jgi:PIN domain nuclease of toxin-antitoxin system
VTHLLDTNAWLRALCSPQELNAATKTLLSDATKAPFALSAISVWEVCTKFRKKPHELSIKVPIEQWLVTALDRQFIQVIPVDAELAQMSNALPDPFHEDPADRIIVATARRAGIILVTSDSKILQYPHVQTLDTR